MESRGDYFDGKNSTRIRVELCLTDSSLQVRGEELRLDVPLAALRLSDAIGSVSRSIYFQDGSKCEIRNDAFATALQKKLGKGRLFGWVHRFESSLKLATIALLLTVIAVWGFIRFGIPVLAGWAAETIPPAVEVRMGKESMAVLDRSLFEESGLPEWRQQQVRDLFAGILVGLEQDQRDYRLEFRESGALGANALALPGGTVVVTDGLMELLDRDEQLIAVLAHEIGHIQHRHVLRKILQDSGAGLLIAVLTGDLTSASSIAAALPTMLVDAKFSRDMEREADDVAIAYLRQQEIPLQYFADILQGLQESRGGEQDSGTAVLEYLSSHPATRERIERLRAAGP